MQQMRRSGNKEENKRILMDLDVVLKSHDCPYIVQCFGTFITNVRRGLPPILPSPPPGPPALWRTQRDRNARSCRSARAAM